METVSTEDSITANVYFLFEPEKNSAREKVGWKCLICFIWCDIVCERVQG